MPPAPTLVILAAGLSTRFGSPKQLVPVGPSGEALLDYALFDAARAGFGDAILIIRPETEAEFRRHAAEVVGERFPVRWVHQTREIATSHGKPVERRTPWGTGHAVLAAGPAVRGLFAVCNADDCYGADAYRQVGELLASRDPATAEHVLVAYRLDATLSPHGAVSRAIVEPDANGYLVSLAEVREIARRRDGIAGTSLAGDAVSLHGRERVSMNLWGFTPAVLPVLERQFQRFLAAHGADPGREFLLSEALGEQVGTGEARVRVLPAESRWFGMTVAADAEPVRRAIGELVAQGAYPSDLRTGFRNL